jgi:hypothetical protein
MGFKSDYFTVVVKTEKGVSLLLIEKDMKGVTIKKMKPQGMRLSFTVFKKLTQRVISQ